MHCALQSCRIRLVPVIVKFLPGHLKAGEFCAACVLCASCVHGFICTWLMKVRLGIQASLNLNADGPILVTFCVSTGQQHTYSIGSGDMCAQKVLEGFSEIGAVLMWQKEEENSDFNSGTGIREICVQGTHPGAVPSMYFQEILRPFQLLPSKPKLFKYGSEMSRWKGSSLHQKLSSAHESITYPYIFFPDSPSVFQAAQMNRSVSAALNHSFTCSRGKESSVFSGFTLL
jgi:hypothetical protein